ncbi:MAG: hypothetical protein U0174_21810 [Polyangiaceae bacterium]
MRSRQRSTLAQYTNSTRIRWAGALVAMNLAATIACGDSEDGGGGGSLVNASSSSGYVPATPATMPQLPPGAGPPDAAVVPPPDTGSGKDVSTSDVTTDSAADTGGDAPPG